MSAVISYRNIAGIVLLLCILPWLALAQQPPPPPGPSPQFQAQQQQKSTQYLRIEYERCRGDLVEIWTKTDVVEQRAKDLEAEVQKLTEELAAVKGKLSEKPAN